MIVKTHHHLVLINLLPLILTASFFPHHSLLIISLATFFFISSAPSSKVLPFYPHCVCLKCSCSCPRCLIRIPIISFPLSMSFPYFCRHGPCFHRLTLASIILTIFMFKIFTHPHSFRWTCRVNVFARDQGGRPHCCGLQTTSNTGRWLVSINEWFLGRFDQAKSPHFFFESAELLLCSVRETMETFVCMMIEAGKLSQLKIIRMTILWFIH